MTITLPVALTVLFVTLQLTGVITWWWVWVLAPLWVPFALGLLVVVAALIVAAAMHIARAVSK